MAEEAKVEGPRNLSLMETFKLYLWTMWKSGALSDASTANILGFADRLGPEHTINTCMGQLEQLAKDEKEVYDGARRGPDFVVNGVAGSEVVATNTAGYPQSVASTPTGGSEVGQGVVGSEGGSAA